jgi:hypothetical protein
MYQLVVFVHVAAAFIFFMAHGAAMAMAFRLRRERQPERVRAIMELSASMTPLMGIAWLVLLLAGIAAGFMGRWWSQGWIGVSLLLMIVLSAWMSYTVRQRYTPIRDALGINERAPKPAQPLPEPSEETLAALIEAANPWVLLLPGLGLTAVILWLMLFKPF